MFISTNRTVNICTNILNEERKPDVTFTLVTACKKCLWTTGKLWNQPGFMSDNGTGAHSIHVRPNHFSSIGSQCQTGIGPDWSYHFQCTDKLLRSIQEAIQVNTLCTDCVYTLLKTYWHNYDLMIFTWLFSLAVGNKQLSLLKCKSNTFFLLGMIQFISIIYIMYFILNTFRPMHLSHISRPLFRQISRCITMYRYLTMEFWVFPKVF